MKKARSLAAVERERERERTTNLIVEGVSIPQNKIITQVYM